MTDNCLYTGSKNKGSCCGQSGGMKQMTKDSEKSYRRVEIVYHLSQASPLDHHPHMIQVQYPSDRSGPCLRDVKNRLTSLRGQGMPDAFSWSNKRNYRGTFIWCDLCEDDVILPLRGSGQYVLKASVLFDDSQDTKNQHQGHHLASKSTSVIKSEVAHFQTKPSKQRVDLDALNSDVSMDISKSLLLINDSNKLTSGSSCVNVNEQAMGTLSNFETTPEVCTLDDSNVSRFEAYLPVEATKSNKVPKKMVRGQSNLSTASEIAYYPLCCEGSALHPQKMLDVAIQTTGLSPGHQRTQLESDKDTTPVFPPHTAAITRDLPSKKRACKKEARSFPVHCGRNTQNSVSSRNENRGMNVLGLLHSVSPRLGSPDGDYIGLGLKSAASLEGYRARLCRNIDVVESHTQLEVQKTRIEGKSNSEKRDKETKLISVFLGRHFQTASSKKMVKDSKLDSSGPSGKKSGFYLRLIGDEVFDLGCKKVGVIHHAVSHSKSSKSVGDAANGMLKSISSSTTPPVSLSTSPILFNPPEHMMHKFATEDSQRRAQFTPEDIKTPTFSGYNLSGNDSSTPELKKVEAASSASVNPLPPKLHSGSKQGMKSSPPESPETLSTASDQSITSDTQLWLKDQARPRDFKSMDERPLTPGLTSIDWEKMLQAAVSQSQPPPDLVLHECLQCGRTFKLDSLTVHMRGCHAPTRAAKPTVTLLRRVPA